MNPLQGQNAQRRSTFAVVIPAYNVAPSIATVISHLPHWIDHIIVVDDCSADGSADAARATGDPRLHIIRHDVNGGVGAATKTGYGEAIRLGADVVIKIDGDGQMDPAHLPALVSPILRNQADYTKGNRFRNKTALRDMPTSRRIGNLVLSFLTKLASGYWDIFDPTNGYTAARREVLLALPLNRVADRYFFETSMLVRLNVLNACVMDITMPSHYSDENSSLRLGQVLVSFPPNLAASVLTRLWNKYFLYDFTAVSLFILAGIPLVLTGGILGVKYWSHSITSGQPATAGQVMLSVLPLLIGFQLLLEAFVIDISNVPKRSGFAPSIDLPIEALPNDSSVSLPVDPSVASAAARSEQ